MTYFTTKLLKILTHKAICFCSRAIRLFTTLLHKCMGTALIQDFHQWFYKEKAHKAMWVIR